MAAKKEMWVDNKGRPCSGGELGALWNDAGDAGNEMWEAADLGVDSPIPTPEFIAAIDALYEYVHRGGK